jgi:hypothetical protein
MAATSSPFIRGDELEKLMRHSLENRQFVSRGHLCPFEKPPIDLRSESILATAAILINIGAQSGRVAILWGLPEYLARLLESDSRRGYPEPNGEEL